VIEDIRERRYRRLRADIDHFGVRANGVPDVGIGGVFTSSVRANESLHHAYVCVAWLQPSLPAVVATVRSCFEYMNVCIDLVYA
jgi:hypothetical protein